MKLTDQELMDEFENNPNLRRIVIDGKSPDDLRKILKSCHDWLNSEESSVAGWLYQRQIMANQNQRRKSGKE